MSNPLLIEARESSRSGMITKPLIYYAYYSDFLDRHSINPRSVIELGTYLGESARIFSRSFPDARIITIDSQQRDLNFIDYPNITFIQASQIDAPLLTNTINQAFPDGVDLIIDDASHIGMLSKISFDMLFPMLTPGGAYFVEDWGTGYWDNSVDGSRFQNFPLSIDQGNIPKRIPSHDFGMVGFVKSLIDLTHESAIRASHDAPVSLKSRISSLEFREGVVMALKSSD